jgi:hypothetical protein
MLSLTDEERVVITRMTTGAGAVSSFANGLETTVTLKDGRKVTVKTREVFVDGELLYKHRKRPLSVKISADEILFDGKSIVKTRPLPRKSPMRSVSLRNFFEKDASVLEKHTPR